MGVRLALAALLLTVGACGPRPGEQALLQIENGTTLKVIVTVHGAEVDSEIQVGPGGAFEADTTRLSDLPWTVDARTESGRLVASMTVQPGQVTALGGVFGRADLSCGRFDMWVGATRPGGPPPGPGVPGDCEP